METSKYRKVSELEEVNPYPFCVCHSCQEIFFNDTMKNTVYCPKHPEYRMENFPTEARALKQIKELKTVHEVNTLTLRPGKLFSEKSEPVSITNRY